MSVDDFVAALRGYDFDDPAVILGRPLTPDLEGLINDVYVQVPLRVLNRHGLIAGATGTGKTKTLQVMAEQLSRQGVPVLLADLKGDLTGLAQPGGPNPAIEQRMAEMELPWTAEAFPVELLSLTGRSGAPLRVTVSSFGPLLMSKVLGCTEVQESVLQALFRLADEQGWALLDLIDLTTLLRYVASEEGKELAQQYGGMSTQTVNVLLRRVLELEGQGGEDLFGEPEFDITDLMRTAPDGRGIITILDLTDVQTRPRLFSTVMMWLLAELYESLDEVGDTDAPRLVFFFDEAHLLFDGATRALREAVETTVRMIRSKGVGVFFVTQHPTDLPDEVLAQLGNRIQHALRAYTPQDHKALSATARTFPTSPIYDVRELLTSLGTGEALVAVLGPDGAPAGTVPTRIVAPCSRMDPVTDTERAALTAASSLRQKYAEEIDRESAYELLAARLERTGERARGGERGSGRRAARRSRRQSPAESFVKSAASAIGREVGRSLIRGLLGTLRR